MSLYSDNIKNQLQDYKSNEPKETSFLDQFKPINTTPKESLIQNKYKAIESPSTYNVNNENELSMYPFNKFEKLNQAPSGRRDNSLVINSYHTDTTTQYSIKKTEMESFQDKKKNMNAFAGSNEYLNMDRKRFDQSLRYKNNEYLDGTYVRPEEVDGEIAVGGVIRPVQKTQEELRGYGVNSIRLQSEGRTNETGQKSRGYSQDPNKVNITKFPQKKYFEQNPEDYLRTTGLYIAPEDRSIVRNLITNRGDELEYVTPAKSLNGKAEYRNNQAARPTQYEEYMDNTHILNPKAPNNMQTSRINQAAKPTQYEDYMDNTHVLNPRAINNMQTNRNNQPARPTQLDDYIGDTVITNPYGYVQKHTHRNNQAANPTQLDEYIGNTVVTNPYGYVQKHTHRNNQIANPTMIEEYIGDTVVTNPHSFVQKNTSRNNQIANPTQREEYSENILVGHGNNRHAGRYYHNGQIANPTQREENTEYNGPGERSTTLTYVAQYDETRSGVVEDVLAKDYQGISRAPNDKGEDRTLLDNYEVNTSIEASTDLTKRKFVAGGSGQLSQGTDNIGDYVVDGNRSQDNRINRGSNVNGRGTSRFESVRSKNILNPRVNTENPVSTVLSGNPYVNNNVHKSISGQDNIRMRTLLSDRELEDVVEVEPGQNRINIEPTKIQPLKYNPNVF
jgi:hypothetical protein